MVWSWNFPLKWSLFRGHVHFQGGNSSIKKNIEPPPPSLVSLGFTLPYIFFTLAPKTWRVCFLRAKQVLISTMARRRRTTTTTTTTTATTTAGNAPPQKLQSYRKNIPSGFPLPYASSCHPAARGTSGSLDPPGNGWLTKGQHRTLVAWMPQGFWPLQVGIFPASESWNLFIFGHLGGVLLPPFITGMILHLDVPDRKLGKG